MIGAVGYRFPSRATSIAGRQVGKLESYQVNTLVVGAGVVGLAIARELAQAGRELLLVEAEENFGTVTSSRNSEVVHAGIYYPAGTLKARACVVGKQMLYRYCESKAVPYRRCGKLIVAQEPQHLAKLQVIQKQAEANGVDDLQMLDARQLKQTEPEIRGIAALWSPSTGIVDSHTLMLNLLGDIESAGGLFATHSRVTSGELRKNAHVLNISGEQPCEVRAQNVINCTGLDTASLLACIRGYPSAKIRRLYFAKGDYFALSGNAPFKHLIYPLPEPGGLGIHLTLDLAGQARFGPDVEWVEQPCYDVDASKRDKFVDAIRRYWPGVKERNLHPAYAGIRPKLVAKDKPVADFVIETQEQHGIEGWINLWGIESPGLTASLYLAELVRKYLSS